jgi:hypothetical protein
MSVKRALEQNFVKRLTSALIGTEYPVVESKELTEERPSPVVICISGDAENPFDNLPQSYGNYQLDLTILVMTSKDSEDATARHETAVTRIESAMSQTSLRTESLIGGLHLYEVLKSTVAGGDEDRRLGTAITYRAVVNYQPLPTP